MNKPFAHASAANLSGRHLLGIEGLSVPEIQALLSRSSHSRTAASLERETAESNSSGPLDVIFFLSSYSNGPPCLSHLFSHHSLKKEKKGKSTDESGLLKLNLQY